jgi:hypothetical protein
MGNINEVVGSLGENWPRVDEGGAPLIRDCADITPDKIHVQETMATGYPRVQPKRKGRTDLENVPD